VSGFFQLDPEAVTALSQRWQALVSSLDACSAVVDATFSLLQKHHSERGRHYHTLGHVRALLDLADEFAGQMRDPRAVQLAIWFHDAIYRSRRADSEERSAQLAIAALGRLRVPAEVIEQVARMIRATKGHDAAGLDEDGRWFLDLDLAIFGADAQLYREYRQAIRREYRWVPSLLYRRGRREVLEGFARRERLFHQAPMHERLEAQARSNIAAELKALGA
jgi:predicted metal-dependent HD superfamily phosphohydrolase